MLSWTAISLIGAGALSMMLIERTGARTTLNTRFKGDVKRESRWLSQYGQGACTLAAAGLVFELDPSHNRAALAVMVAAFGASLAGLIIKRICGRARPDREAAGRFLGFTWKHDNSRESFPSSHSASAIAMTVLLAHLYPQATVTFWTLGLICAALRYVMDAHWPSDVLAGIALGAAIGNVVILGFGFGPLV